MFLSARLSRKYCAWSNHKCWLNPVVFNGGDFV